MTFGLLHARRGIVAVGGDRVGAFAEHDRIGARGIVACADPRLPSQPPKWNGIQATPLPTRSVTSAFILALRIVLGAAHPDPAAVLDAAVGGIGAD